jgi:hypothetical protein
MMRRTLLSLVATLAALAMIVAAGPAFAGPYGEYPPDIKVYKAVPGGSVYLQTAHTQSFEWYSYDRDTNRWGVIFGTGLGKYPVADTVSANKFILLQYRHPKPPKDIWLKSYDRRDRSDKPITLKPGWYGVRNSKGEVVKQVIMFKLQEPHAQHYIVGFFRVDKASRHNYSYGKTSFTAHLKTY